MRHFAALGCLTAVALSIQAAPLPDSNRPAPGTEAARSARLVDRDGDRISDDLQARIAAARPGDLVRVVVTFSGPGTAATARQAVGAFTLDREFRIIRGFSATMTTAQIRALAQQPGVRRIEEDFTVSTKLNAARADFGTDAARTSFGVDGAGIKGCIVDTGVDPNHEQLDARPIPFFDVINGRTSAYDDHGHGTHVASIAFGDGTGGSGAATYKGVAPGAAIYAAKVLDQSGSGLESQVIAGIDWCVSQGVRIISMSLGSSAPSDGQDSLSQAVDAAVSSGAVVVVAAGNSGDEPGTVGSPGAAAQAITVAACAEWSAPAGAPNHSDGIYVTPFSSRGPTLDNRVKPDICAPGLTITAAKAGTVSGYVTYSGTSMATPFVSGIVALALQANPILSPADLRQKLEATAQDRGPAGKDNDIGAGLLDGYALVASAKGGTSYQPTVFPTYRRVTGSVANHGQWSYTFSIAEADLDVPIGATVTINGQAKCILPLLGGCFAAQWDPDLDTRLLDPNGVVLSESLCMAGVECGGIGRQETLHALPTVAGTYTIQVSPSEDSVNLGKGGSFALDLSSGPRAGIASLPVAHVGGLSASSTGNKTGWTTTVTVTVHDASHNPVPNATVSGTWSGGYSGNSACTTGAGGQCMVTSGTISKRKNSVTFTVTNITGTLTYQASSNDMTSVTATKP